MSMEFDATLWTDVQLKRIEHALNRWVSTDISVQQGHEAPVTLVQAMRYCVLDGGKRLRPLLVLAAYEAVAPSMNLPSEAALRAACAVELIHAYSLAHDDMPCMDNDVLRRGKPTAHVQFGEAVALLAGDALQALAFELLTPPDSSVALHTQAHLCSLLARAAGCAGMAGGQAIDLASVGHQLNEKQLREMHALKTGALLQASVLMGAYCAGVPSAAVLTGLKNYGAAVGLAFQVMDDVLDVTSNSVTLGKTAGKDAQQDKPTYVSLLGLQASQIYAQSLLTQAMDALDASGLVTTQALRALAHKLVNRSH